MVVVVAPVGYILNHHVKLKGAPEELQGLFVHLLDAVGGLE